VGENIILFENANIDASGNKCGGTVLIGNAGAKTLFADEGAVIFSDAIEEGDGGIVFAGAEEKTHFFGTVSACGGERGGNGGTVTIFGNHVLDFQGEIDLSAPFGNTGIFHCLKPDLIVKG
jgi:hypothetical protein